MIRTSRRDAWTQGSFFSQSLSHSQRPRKHFQYVEAVGSHPSFAAIAQGASTSRNFASKLLQFPFHLNSMRIRRASTSSPDAWIVRRNLSVRSSRSSQYVGKLGVWKRNLSGSSGGTSGISHRSSKGTATSPARCQSLPKPHHRSRRTISRGWNRNTAGQLVPTCPDAVFPSSPDGPGTSLQSAVLCC